MQKCRPVTDSAGYAVQFGGVWLEYHKRIESAERELSTAKFICDEVTAERDALLAEKFVLEKKFKDSIASLTQTETDHLEAKQIVDKVREEQKALARRCLASEAHTEWLEDQVKQLKAHRSIKEDEIASLLFRIENLKSTLADGVSTQDSLKEALSQRDNEIATLKNLLKSRDEEIVVQSRSLHSKDRQLAQLVKERNAFKDDLTDTQRSLALARRTSAVNRKTESVKISTVASSGTKLVVHRMCEIDSAVKEVNRMNVSTDSTNSEDSPDAAAPSQPNTAHNSGSINTVLRRYKSSLHSRTKSLSNTMTDSVANSSVLLEDILMSVLSPDPDRTTGSSFVANHAGVNGSECMNTSMEIATECAVECVGSCNNNIASVGDNTRVHNVNATSSAEHIMTTPVVTRKSPLTLSDAATDLVAVDNLHLDDLDLDYIDAILDTPGTVETVVKGRASRALAPVDVENINAVNTAVDRCIDGRAVQKTLFAASPAPKRCSRTHIPTIPIHSTSRRSSMNVSGFSSSGVSSNGLVGSSGSGISATANPWAVPKPKVRTIGSTSTTPLCTGTTTSTTAAPSTEAMDVSTFLQRERDYKSALYLLQEEVRLLRSQVAGFEAAKRSIRGTPKKKTVNTSFAQVVA